MNANSIDEVSRRLGQQASDAHKAKIDHKRDLLEEVNALIKSAEKAYDHQNWLAALQLKARILDV